MTITHSSNRMKEKKKERKTKQSTVNTVYRCALVAMLLDATQFRAH